MNDPLIHYCSDDAMYCLHAGVMKQVRVQYYLNDNSIATGLKLTTWLWMSAAMFLPLREVVIMMSRGSWCVDIMCYSSFL